MSGILDYQRYIELFATVKDVIEHFPSEQYTLPYSFNNQGTRGYTATIHYQSFILDQFSYSQERIPNFGQSSIVGYFPEFTVNQYTTSTVILPKDMYQYPMYPERLTLAPVTLVSLRFYKDKEIFTRQLLLIENWEPGISIGNPADDPNYTAIDQTGYNFRVNLTLNTTTFYNTGSLTVNGTSTAIGAVTTATSYFDNTATLTIRQGSNIFYSTVTNFIDGNLNLSTIIGNNYFPVSVENNTYTITTGSFTTSTFNFSATINNNFNLDLVWKSLQLTDGIILGGSTSSIFSISTTLNQTSALIPLSISVIDTLTNTTTVAAWSSLPIELRATGNLQVNYPAQANQVEFWADYSPDYNIQTYTIPEQDQYGGTVNNVTVQMPRKIQNNEILLEYNGTDILGKTFQFPYILNNGFKTPGVYNLSTNTASWALNNNLILTQYQPSYNLATSALYQSQSQDLVVQGTGTYTVNLSCSIGPVPTSFTYSFGPRPNTYLLKTYVEFYRSEENVFRLKGQNVSEGIIYGHMAGYNQRTLTVNNIVNLTTTDNNEYLIRVYAYLTETGRSGVAGPSQIKGYGGSSMSSTVTSNFYRTQRFDTGTYTLTTLLEVLPNGGKYRLNKNWQYNPYNEQYYQEQGNQLSLPNGVEYYPSNKIRIDNNVYSLLNDQRELIRFYGFEQGTTPAANTRSNRLKVDSIPYTTSGNIVQGIKYNSLISTGSTFTFNSTLTYRIASQDVTATTLILDPPWWGNNSDWWDNINANSITVQGPNSSQNIQTATIQSLVYSKGLNVPYYDGAYEFNQFTTANPPAVGSQFKLAGNNTSPTTTTFVVQNVVGNTVSFAPNYTVTTSNLFPQWQRDNLIYNHFVNYEVGRPIVFIYDVNNTSQATLLAVGGQYLLFDTIPYNLRVGATVNLGGNITPIIAIDSLRNIITVNSDVSSWAFDKIGTVGTFTNPANPTTTSTFLGTASIISQVDNNFTWKLGKTLTQGQYQISAQVKKSVLTGTNVAYIYPTTSTQKYIISSSQGIDAGLYVTVYDEGTKDRIIMTSNVLTARNPDHYYVYNTPVTWYVNSSTISTSSWIRQGTSFIQTATLLVNKGVVNQTLYGDWPGTLNYTRTYSDQLLFNPDQVGIIPMNTTTVYPTTDLYQSKDYWYANAYVRVTGNQYPYQTLFSPSGTISTLATQQTVNYTNGGSSNIGETKEIAVSRINSIGTSSAFLSVYNNTYFVQDFVDRTGFPKYYRLTQSYSGDAFRYASTSTSPIITFVPNYFNGIYKNEVKYNTSPTSFNNGTFLQLNQQGFVYDVRQNWAYDVFVDTTLDVWLEPVITTPWTSSLSLTSAIVKPWIVYSIGYNIQNFVNVGTNQFTLDCVYAYNYPQNTVPKVIFYENNIVEQRNYELKRTIRFIVKFPQGSYNYLNWITPYVQIGTPSSFSYSANGKDNVFAMRSNLISANQSTISPI